MEFSLASKSYSIEYIVLSIELRKKEKEKKQHSSFYLATPLKFTPTLMEFIIALRESRDNIEGTGVTGNDKGK